MSDENIVDFGKALSESKSDNAESVEERVMQCMENKDCECMYCTYRENAAGMVLDFLSRDIIQFEKNTGAHVSTFDLKMVFFGAIMKIKEMEKEGDDEEN